MASFAISEAISSIQQSVDDLDQIISLMKTSGGHLTPLGKAFIETACEKGVTHANIARIMGITRGAVSAYMRKLENGQAEGVIA